MMTSNETPSSLFPEVPNELYYYADASGLSGILSHGVWEPEHTARAARFLASDVRYMNDTSELKFGAALTLDRLSALAKDPSISPGLRAELSGYPAAFDLNNLGSWRWRCFATCFSEESDLLSQWQTYAGGTGGYAIGLGGKIVESSAMAVCAYHPIKMVMNTRLVKIAYGEIECEKRLDFFIDNIRRDDAAGGFSGGPPSTLGLRAIDYLSINTFLMMATVKDKAFAAEREWRLLTVTAASERVFTRASISRGILPFVEMVINSQVDRNGDWVTNDPPLLPDPPTEQCVKEIVVGPTADQEFQVSAVKDLLRARDPSWVDPIPVRSSVVPFRG